MITPRQVPVVTQDQLQPTLIRAEETISPGQVQVVSQDQLPPTLIRAECRIQQGVSLRRPCPLVYLQ